MSTKAMTIYKTKHFKKALHNIILILSLVCLGASLISTIFIICNSNIKFNLTYIGFNDFQSIFSFPLRAFSLFVILLGIWIAYKKYQQADEHFNKTHKLTILNLHFNNYSKHMDLYIYYMMDYFEYFKHNIASNAIIINNNFGNNVEIDYSMFTTRLIKGFFRDLYYKWFYKDIDNFKKIESDIYKKICSFSDYFLENYSEIVNGEQLNYFHDLKAWLTNINLFGIVIHLNKNEQMLNNFRLKTVFAIIKKTLDFSEQKIDNIDKLYSILCQEKH